MLIKELVKGNSELINNEELITILVNQLFDKISFYDYGDIRKSICLDILSYVIADLGEQHKNNQTLVIKKLFSQGHFNIIPENGFNDEIMAHAQLNSARGIISGSNQAVKIPEKMMYFYCLLKLLATCGDGKSAFAENIG